MAAKLTPGFKALAMQLQEAATAVSMDEIRQRLSGCLSEHFEGTGEWAYLIDVMGDDKSGKCIYSCSGLYQAEYKLRTTDSKATATIDFESAISVVAHTTYKATEAASVEARAVLEQQKANAARETDISLTLGTLALTESAATLDPIVLREARADYEIRLISPGKGSSAFYPREVLQRDGPKIFKAGTHVYLNHPTAAEESARPEGDVANLAGVLATDAVYHESHPKGEGLYARMKVFQDHAQLVEEKAPHVGMSIRAGGIAEANTKKDGLPVLKELTHAESVDIVTRPGRDGRIFTESALPGSQSQQEADMTAEETKRLIEAETKTYWDALAAANGKLVRSEARDHVAELLEGITLPAATKVRIRDRVMEALPLKESGDLDVEKLREAVAKVAKSEGEYLASITGSGQVTGMGISTRAPLTEAEITAQEAREEREAASHTKLMESTASVFEELGLDKNAAKRAAYKGVM